MTEILLTTFYTFLFSFIIYKWGFFKKSELSVKQILVLFYIKVFASFILTLIYTYYYSDRSTSDIYKYFDDSKVMFDAIYHKPLDYLKMLTGIGNNTPYFSQYYEQMNNWTRVYESNIYNDSHTIIRFNALVRMFSFGYFYVHNVFMAFLSFIGLFSIYKVAIEYMPQKAYLLAFGIFFMPSTIFWGSGVLKEGLIFFNLGVLLYCFNKLLTKRFSMINILLIVFCSFILIYIKIYILLCFIPPALAYLWVHFTSEKKIWMKYSLVFFLYLLIGLNFYRIFPDYNALEILSRKQADFIGLAQSMKSGSLIKIGILEPNFWSLLLNTPLALLNTLFRPFLWEVSNPLMLISALENLIIIAFIFLTIVFYKSTGINRNILFFCILFFIETFILTGLITPVIGAIVRYKVPALPFLMGAFVILIDQQKLILFFSKFAIKKN